MADLPVFADLAPPASDLETAAAAILPVPYERTTCWVRGTERGPEALLSASHHVELWDDELARETSDCGIATLPPIEPASREPAAALEEIRRAALPHRSTGRFVVALGGEHALTAPLVAAAAEAHGELGVVQFDAHADLRDEYEGTPHSHACVMRRILDAGHPTLAVGLRSLSAPEAELIAERRLPVVWGRELDGLTPDRFAALLGALPDRVYLTFDLDFFDPSLLPATGTPVAGGGSWYPTLALLRRLFAEKVVVAMDVVELCPRQGDHASDFAAASLVYKAIGYRQVALAAGDRVRRGRRRR